MEFTKLSDTALVAAVGLVVAALGWWVAHYLAAKRDIKNKHREQRISYLIEAFKDLNHLRSFASSLDIKEVSTALTRIANNIELFGTQRQIDQFRILAQGVANDKGTMSNVHDLIDSLRDDLRSMIGLEVASGNVSYFKISGQ